MNKLSIFIKSISQFILYKPMPAYAQLIFKENISLRADKAKTLKKVEKIAKIGPRT
jgi:hypothetical protein